MGENFVIPDETVINRIYLFRNQKVMLDKDLAMFYGIATKVLNQAVKRNIRRFPESFMFQLDSDEFDSLKLRGKSTNWGGRRTHPYAFTEHGVLMLSSIINSEKANERIKFILNQCI